MIRLSFELHIVANWNERKYSLPSVKAKYFRTPFIRKPVIRITNHPNRLGPSDKYFRTAIVLLAQWLRCCATNRKVAGSIPDGVIGIFH